VANVNRGPTQSVTGANRWERETGEQMHTSVSRAEEPTVDVKLCLVFPQNTWQGFAVRRLPGLRRRTWPATSAAARNRRRSGRPVAGIGRSLLGVARAGQEPEAGPETIRDEDIAALPESGRGFDIMRACVDDVTMSSGPEHRTVVSLQKRLAWRPGAPFAQVSAAAEAPASEFADAG